MSSFQPGSPIGANSVRSFLAFKKLDLKKVDAEELQKELQSALDEDPLITDASNISVNINREDNKPHLTLIGKVSDEREKLRAQEILEENTKDNATISNELLVEK